MVITFDFGGLNGQTQDHSNFDGLFVTKELSLNMQPYSTIKC